MGKSARQLGEEYGLSSQEMNYILKKEGYLEGEPGEYSITDKGAPYAKVTDFHRGTGGYAFYNRDWITIKWNEILKDVLNITEEMKEEAREAVRERRKQKQDERKAASIKADEDFLARKNQMENEDDEETTKDGLSPLKVLGLLSLLVAGVYGIYKATPRVKKWWKNRQTTKLRNSQKTVTKKVVYKYIRCPVCGDKVILNDKTSMCVCNKCNFSITNKEIEDGAVFWYCDKCKSFLNNQQGFTTKNINWVCTECGFDNEITEVNADQQD